MNILITSGGTNVPIDRVRHIANMSRGTFGSKIAYEMVNATAGKLDKLIFLMAKHSLGPFQTHIDWAENNLTKSEIEDILEEAYNLSNKFIDVRNQYEQVIYSSFNQYKDTFLSLLSSQKWDIIVVAAAVSDYSVSNYVNGKIRSSSNLQIQLQETEKIITQIRKFQPSAVLVGFKLLVDSTDDVLIEAAQKVCTSANCNFVVANDLEDIQRGQHRLILVDKESPKGIRSTYYTKPSDPNYLARMVVKEALAERV